MPRDLSLGMTGSDVATLQKLLNHHLSLPIPPLAEDGTFGPTTKARVLDFQKRNHLLPTKLPYPSHYPSEFRQALAIDGIVGQHTLHVLVDIRKIRSAPGASVAPRDEASRASRARSVGTRFGVAPGTTGDPPAPAPAPTPTPTPPNRSFKFIQLQQGTAGFMNPWAVSPLVLTFQGVILVKNEGKPDFLLTAGIQASMNDGNPNANGRWSGQGFLQMGFDFNLQTKLFGRTLDIASPFFQAMVAQNLNNKLKHNPAPTVGGAIGNQITWKLIERKLPGAVTPDDTQDTVSVFFNGQVASSTALNNGQAQAPVLSGMLGVTWSFF